MRIADEVLAVLAQADCDPCWVALSPDVRLPRPLYLQVNQVLEALGGKWSRKTKRHDFRTCDVLEMIEMVLISGEVTTARELSYFPTPPEIAAQAVAALRVEPGMTVLEPSAGRGDLILALPLGVEVYAVEMDDQRFDYLRSQFLPPAGVYLRVSHGDFCGREPGLNGMPATVDRVLMNPPFAGGEDIDHVLQAVRYLRPGGRLVSIMSAGVVFRQERRWAGFRRLVAEHEGTIEPLPEGAFKSAGTNVRAVLVTLPW